MAGVMTVISGVISTPSTWISKITKQSSMVTQAKQSQGKFLWPHLCYASVPSTQKIVTTEPHRVEEKWLREEETYNLG